MLEWVATSTFLPNGCCQLHVIAMSKKKTCVPLSAVQYSCRDNISSSLYRALLTSTYRMCSTILEFSDNIMTMVGVRDNIRERTKHAIPFYQYYYLQKLVESVLGRRLSMRKITVCIVLMMRISRQTSFISRQFVASLVFLRKKLMQQKIEKDSH